MNKSKELSDSILVEQYQSGNNKALAILVERWHKKFCNQAYWYTKNADLSKDIAQESWTVIIHKINDLRESDKFGSWGLSIVNRKAIDSLRKQNKYIKLRSFDEINLVEKEESKDSNLKEIILVAIKNLPEEQQLVLQLFYVEAYKIYQIAELLNIANGTVKSRLFTAREKLKSILITRNHER